MTRNGEPASAPRQTRSLAEAFLGKLPATLFGLALLVGGLGCASSCPRYADQDWRELSTANFRLRTDLGEDEARAKLNKLEMFRAALLTSFRVSPAARTGQVSVVVLDAGWGAAAGPLVDGVFSRDLFTPQIAMRADSNLLGQLVVKHELVHYLSRYVRPSDPPWLAEGLAMYFQTLEISDDHRLVTVGRPEPKIVSLVQRIGILSIDEMFAGTDVHDSRGFFYRSAWLLVHYLMNHRGEAFRSYQRVLAASMNEAQAWTASLGDLTPAQLDAQLQEYVDGGEYYLYKFPFQPPPVQITGERALKPADAHALRALIYAVMSRHTNTDMLPRTSEELKTCACQELAWAFRDDADHALGLAVKTWELGQEIEVARAQRSAERAPADWMAWWLLAATLRRHGTDDQRADAAEDKAVTLVAGNPAIDLKVVRHVRRSNDGRK